MTMTVTRRRVLGGAGFLLVGYRLSIATAIAAPPRIEAPRNVGPGSVDAWIAISRSGQVTAFTGKVDLGTGIETAFAQIVADELAAPIEQVRIVMGDTALTPDQGRSTASQAVVSGAQPLRVAAAAARDALIHLAAEKWRVSPEALEAADGAIRLRAQSRKRIGYGALIGDKRFAIDLDIAQKGNWGPVLKVRAPLKSAKDYEVIGRDVPRFDVPAKVTGTFEYVQNVRLPNMLHGRVVRPPSFGARLVSVDKASLPAAPGAQIVQQGDFLAVVAEREEDAINGAAKLRAQWSEQPTLPEQATIYDALRSAKVIGETKGQIRGDVEAGLTQGKTRLTADYEFPFQLHGMMGPSCAVADVHADGATIWSGTQSPYSDRDDLADMLGLPHDRVRIVWREAAGSYGRLATDDAAADAALLSRMTGRPVRVQWMRHDEHGWEPSSPAVAMRITGALDQAGQVVALDYTQWSASHAYAEKGNELAWRAIGTAPGWHRLSGWATAISYDFPALRVRNLYVEPWMRNVYMRSPGGIQAIFAYESFMDEAAHAVGADPVEFRLRHLDDARDREALTRAARLAGWQPRPSFPPGAAAAERMTGRGIALARYGAGETRVAMVADIEVERRTGRLHVKQLSIAVDCGLVINPDGARNQIEGAALQGISRAMMEEMHFDRSKVTSIDWKDYPILRFSGVPEVKIDLIDRRETPSSALGEICTVPAAAVLGNAIFDATGKRLRRVPFTPDRILSA